MKSNIIELTENEMKKIDGGGSAWRYLGKIMGHFGELCESIQKANLEAPVSVSTWN